MAKRKNGEKLTFADVHERTAWGLFASGAASGCQGEGDDPTEDAAIAADFADALLVEWRARNN